MKIPTPPSSLRKKIISLSATESFTALFSLFDVRIFRSSAMARRGCMFLSFEKMLPGATAETHLTNSARKSYAQPPHRYRCLRGYGTEFSISLNYLFRYESSRSSAMYFVFAIIFLTRILSPPPRLLAVITSQFDVFSPIASRLHRTLFVFLPTTFGRKNGIRGALRTR